MAGSPDPAPDEAVTSPAEARVPRDPTLPAAGLLMLAVLAVYRATLLPGLGFWDTGEAQTVLPLLGTMHPTGFPAFVVIGWLFSIVARPLGEPAFLMNLMAAVCAAGAAGGTVLVTRRLHAPLPVALAAGLGLALTPIAWHISTASDAHALHLFLVVALTLALLRWQSLVDEREDHPGDDAFRRRGDRAVILAAAVYGVAIANHALSLILAPSIVLFVLAVEPRVLLRPRLIVTAVATAAGVAALLYLELPLRAGPLRAPIVYAHPETWKGFWEIVMAKQFQGDVGGILSDLPAKLDALLKLGDEQLGAAMVLVPAGLVVTLVRHPRYALFSGTAVLVTVLFAGSYANANITRYYLGPVFFAWTWMAVLAATFIDAILDRAGVRAEAEAVGAEPAIAAPGSRHVGVALAVGLAFAGAMLIPTALSINTRWKDVDQSQATWAPEWLDQAFNAMAPDAMVVSWWSYSTPMWYGQLVEGRRPDIAIVDDSNVVWDNMGTAADVIDANLGKRPVYVIRVSDSDVQDLAKQFAIQPVGRPDNLYLVTGRLGTTQ